MLLELVTGLKEKINGLTEHNQYVEIDECADNPALILLYKNDARCAMVLFYNNITTNGLEDGKVLLDVSFLSAKHSIPHRRATVDIQHPNSINEMIHWLTLRMLCDLRRAWTGKDNHKYKKQVLKRLESKGYTCGISQYSSLVFS